MMTNLSDRRRRRRPQATLATLRLRARKPHQQLVDQFGGHVTPASSHCDSVRHVCRHWRVGGVRLGWRKKVGLSRGLQLRLHERKQARTKRRRAEHSQHSVQGPLVPHSLRCLQVDAHVAECRSLRVARWQPNIKNEDSSVFRLRTVPSNLKTLV